MAPVYVMFIMLCLEGGGHGFIRHEKNTIIK